LPRKKKRNKATRSISSFVREFGEDAVQMYPVFELKTRRGQKLYHHVCYVSKPERDEMLANGSGASMTSGTAVKLLITLEQFRGQSCSMGPQVIEGNVMARRAKRELIQSLVAGWEPTLVGTYCPLVPA
jgi:hypothetical protein